MEVEVTKNYFEFNLTGQIQWSSTYYSYKLSSMTTIENYKLLAAWTQFTVKTNIFFEVLSLEKCDERILLKNLKGRFSLDNMSFNIGC